jgi:hypothetical protein
MVTLRERMSEPHYSIITELLTGDEVLIRTAAGDVGRRLRPDFAAYWAAQFILPIEALRAMAWRKPSSLATM